jgi:membrane-associated phospholipid phosphatase
MPHSQQNQSSELSIIEKLAKVISYIYHPMVIPTLGILLIFNSGTYLSYLHIEYKKVILIIVFLATFLVPIAFIPFFLYHQIINNVQMASRQERTAPLVLSLILHVICYLLVRRFNIPQAYNLFLIGGVVSILITLLITQRYKISIHMVGAGGLSALVFYLAFGLKVDLHFYLAISVLLAGITGTSRILLKAHSPDQVYSGFLVGFASILLTMQFA